MPHHLFVVSFNQNLADDGMLQERRLLAAGDTFNRVIVWSLLTYAVDKVLQVESFGSLGEAGIDQVHQGFRQF